MSVATLDFRPDDPGYLADPFPFLRRLQDEDPCHWSPRLKSWVLTRYDDVKGVCLDRGMSSDRLRPFFAALPGAEAARIGAIMRTLSLWMVFRDPPDHTRLRRLAAKVFHARSMAARRPRAEVIAAALLEQLGDRRDIDFIADFAGPLPALVIMDMLGVAPEDLAQVKRMSDDMALFIGSSRVAPEKYAVAEAATREMVGFFRQRVAERRAQPREDAITALLQAEEDGERFSDDELIATCILMLFAGHETTTNHLANGLLSLLRFPGELQKLRARPALAPQAVEELLRFDGPSGAQVRVVAQPCTLHGRRLAAGDRVFIMLNAANRDPRAFPEPDQLILERDGVPHLSFGFGAHICLGFPLARMEGQVALPMVLARWRSIALATERLEWLDSMVFRGMKALPLRVAP